jgi:hypothetical protein
MMLTAAGACDVEHFDTPFGAALKVVLRLLSCQRRPSRLSACTSKPSVFEIYRQLTLYKGDAYPELNPAQRAVVLGQSWNSLSQLAQSV